MTNHIQKPSRNGVKGGSDVNLTASPHRVCQARQVKPGRHQAASRINYQEPICEATWNLGHSLKKGISENGKRELTFMKTNMARHG